MDRYRLNLVGIGLAVVGLVFVAVGLWPLSWPFIIASFVCSFISEKRRRQARKRSITASESGWLLDYRDDRSREFEAFCECPRCRLPAYHLFTAPRQEIQQGSTWTVGMGRVWALSTDEYEKVSVWNRAGTYRVRRFDRSIEYQNDQLVTIVDRECLSCRREWTEKVS